MKKIAVLLILAGCRAEFDPSYDDESGTGATTDVPSTNATPTSGSDDSGTSDGTSGADTSETDSTTDDSTSTTDDSTSTTDDSSTGDGDGDSTGMMEILVEGDVCDPLDANKPNGLCDDGLICGGPFWDQFNAHFEFRCQDTAGAGDGVYGSSCFAGIECQTGMACTNQIDFPPGICTVGNNCCTPMCKQELPDCPPNTFCTIFYEPVHPDYMSTGYGHCAVN